MELEELRRTWHSVNPHVDLQINDEEANKIFSNKNDIKSRLLKRVLWEGTFTVFGIVLMALSPIWSPLKFPYWWLVIFCMTLFIANICGIKIYRSIKATNLWENTHKEILITVVSIKKLYRNIELATAVVVIPLMIWLSLSPLFIHNWRMYFTWILTILGFALEYLWYNSNIKKINELVN
ncbi:MAG: hypothetical protein K2J87_03715 [Muribaculaceae bacterium]|nr:hypothetical protein [Muribaculaceae bacterium]